MAEQNRDASKLGENFFLLQKLEYANYFTDRQSAKISLQGKQLLLAIHYRQKSANSTGQCHRKQTSIVTKIGRDISLGINQLQHNLKRQVRFFDTF